MCKSASFAELLDVSDQRTVGNTDVAGSHYGAAVGHGLRQLLSVHPANARAKATAAAPVGYREAKQRASPSL